MTRVFISSTSDGLARFRRAATEVCHRLGLEPIAEEGFTPEAPPPLDVCHRRVDSAQVFVLLVAHRYGTRPLGETQSFPELEYRRALARNLPLHIFVVDRDCPWPPPDIDEGEDREALRRWIAELRTRHTPRSFCGEEAFREELIVTLAQYQQAPAAESDKPAARHIPSAPEVHAVPPYVATQPFTGRDADLAILDNWAASPDTVLVIEAIGGNGKSALSWNWMHARAAGAIPKLAGRLWWSFYEGSASMTRFLQEVAAYAGRRRFAECARLPRDELLAVATAALRAKPYLLVLDGFERLLGAYHRFDPSKLRDDEVDPAARALIDDSARDVLLALLKCAPSKILISTRLMPEDLEGRGHRPLDGVLRHTLPGLTSEDTVTLTTSLGLRGDHDRIRGFFEPLGNHPLLIGVVAGVVSDYRAAPGDFDRWLSDPGAGGALRISELDLKQRRTHVLAVALDGLDPAHRQLLGWLSVLPGSISWQTLADVNPFLPPRPTRPYDAWDERKAMSEHLADWERSEEVRTAPARLDRALSDLVARGLLWWDRSSNTYELHPVVRAFAHDQLAAADRVHANERVRDHFSGLPPDNLDAPTSVDQLRNTITIFRAIVGAGQIDRAAGMFNDFLAVLWFRLAAYPTIIELLDPIADELPVGNADIALCEAWEKTGRRQRPYDVEIRGLAIRINQGNDSNVAIRLQNLADANVDDGQLVAAERQLDFALALAREAGASQEQLISEASLATVRGDLAKASRLLDAASAAVSNSSSPRRILDSEIIIARARISLHATSLTPESLLAAAGELQLPPFSVELGELWLALWLRNGDLDAALSQTHELVRLRRRFGQPTSPAVAARAMTLARIGQIEETSESVDEVLIGVDKVPPRERNYGALAEALFRLGRLEEAASFALESYRTAWCDGPPYSKHWDLQDARRLLEMMGLEEPALPTTDPATVKVPLEDEIRAFIAKRRRRAT